MELTLEELFFISQSVASVAVVGSLIYLGLQVRAGDRNQRALMQQGRADRTSLAALTIADSNRAVIFRKGLLGDPAMTSEEFPQWTLIYRSLLLSGEDSFLQHKARLLDETSYESYVAGARHYLGFPGFRAMWSISRTQFGDDFRDFIEEMIPKIRLHPESDAQAEWVKALEQLRVTHGI